MTKIVIPENIIISMNAVINAAKKHWSKYYQMQKNTVNNIAWFLKAQQIETIKKYPVHITFKFFCKDKKKDPDNISSPIRKFLLDALVLEGILKGDRWRYIKSFKDEFEIDKSNPRIEIVIY